MHKDEQQEILEGLSQSQKRISSKYFYDDTGSRIFQEIMQMPEYYLTDCEFEIFNEQSQEIIKALEFDASFQVVEFGAGDGTKTVRLLSAMLEQDLAVTYVPIDISSEAILHLQKRIETKLPTLEIEPLVGDYFSLLRENLKATQAQKLYLFLGSNIGNYTAKATQELLEMFAQSMQAGDALLLGVDLQKDPKIIHQAYFDPHGITKRFNLNLLIRLNREMEANFKPEAFDFICEYNPSNGELRSYLVSLENQEVTLGGKSFSFTQGERIWTELSKKYTLQELETLAQRTGFVVRNHFKDSRGYFTNSLWIKS